MQRQSKEQVASIPMRLVGPLKIIGPPWIEGEVHVPLATYETPLWPSTQRGAAASAKAGGIHVSVVDDRMTRSILLEAEYAADVIAAAADLKNRVSELQVIVKQTSRYAHLLDIHQQVVGNLLYLRLEFSTGDAAGHNMVTLASDHIQTWILKIYTKLRYVSISGNYCIDKKASAVNGILGRGKYVIAEVILSHALCKRFLKTTPQKIIQLNIKKNLIGSILSGSLRSANAHFANMLLGFYLATGQDAANIIEGSQGIVHAELRNEDLYFSVTLPNIIVGSVGNGKDLTFVRENLKLLGCLEERAAGDNAKRLAVIAAAVVLCGELSLLAAQCNPGELMKSHVGLERGAPEANHNV